MSALAEALVAAQRRAISALEKGYAGRTRAVGTARLVPGKLRSGSVSGEPFPKSSQLARGERRYRRKVASPAQWERIWQAKRGPCRVCSGRREPIDPHHLVLREHGGDDLAENIVPVCRDDHNALHNRAPAIARLLLTRLSDAEYAYMIERGGEDYAERAYGVEYARP